jgi:hypothetical protein
VNFVDGTVVKLADEGTRAGLFDQDSLAQLAAAAFDIDAMAVGGPYQPVFAEFEVGAWIPGVATLEGEWGLQGSADRHTGRLQLSDLNGGPPVRVDGLWRGAIVARAAAAGSPVTKLVVKWPDGAGIDQEIVAALGALPTDPAQLEAERRTRFLARIRAALGQPAAFTDAAFDAWLLQVGAASVGDLLARFRGQIATGGLQLTYAPAPALPDTPRALPLQAVVLVRDAGFAVSDLLADSKRVRRHLALLGLEAPPAPDTKVRQPVLVVWVIPEAVFDDAGWPGGAGGTNDAQRRALRRAAAGKWLAREGIGLVVVAAG